MPKSVTRALHRIELQSLADALRQMPIHARGGDERVSERLDAVRSALRQIEDELWKDLLVRARWRSPLLVMDEAHHLKNPGTALARQLQSPGLDHDEGGSIAGASASSGLPVGPQELLPFYLAARSAVNPGKDLLGEALCSSYEAFRFTIEQRTGAR